MAKITLEDCKIDTDLLRKAGETLKASAEEAAKAISEWTTTTSYLSDRSWATTTGRTAISYGKETQNQEIADLETKIEDAIDNIVMLIKAAKPHDEESLRDRIRCGIEEAFSIEEKAEPKPIETITFSSVPDEFIFTTETSPSSVSTTCYSTSTGEEKVVYEYVPSPEEAYRLEKEFKKEMIKSYIPSSTRTTTVK